MATRAPTARLILEPLDADSIRKALSHEMPEQPRDWPDAMVAPAWELLLQAGLPVAIWAIRTPDGELIGDVGFKGPIDDARSLEVAYFVRPSHRRRGYATEALSAVIAHGFASGAESVRAEVHAGNEASIAVLRRCGFGHSATEGDQLWFVLRRPALP